MCDEMTPEARAEATATLLSLRFARYRVDGWDNDATDEFSRVVWARSVTEVRRWGAAFLAINPPEVLPLALYTPNDVVLY